MGESKSSNVVSDFVLGGLNKAVDLGFGQISANLNSKRAWKYYKKQMALQQQYYEKNLADERAYNSPAAMMSRYEDAGLNPNLIYDNNGASSSGWSPSGSMARFESSVGSSILQDVLAIEQSRANIANVNSSTRKNLADAEFSERSLNDRLEAQRIANATGLENQRALEFQNNLNEELRPYTVNMSAAQYRLTEKQIFSVQANIDKIYSDISNSKKSLQLQQKLLSLRQKEFRESMLANRKHLQKLNAEIEQIKQNTSMSEDEQQRAIGRYSAEMERYANQFSKDSLSLVLLNNEVEESNYYHGLNESYTNELNKLGGLGDAINYTKHNLPSLIKLNTK